MGSDNSITSETVQGSHDTMAISVQMPALGESVTEGTVTRWLKQEGDTVAEDEPLLEVSTDKVDTEIPSPAAGVLKKIVAQEDDTVEVGGELAVIGDADDSDDSDGGSEDSSDDAAPAAEESEPEPPSRSRSRNPSESEPKSESKPAAKKSGSSGSSTPVRDARVG